MYCCFLNFCWFRKCNINSSGELNNLNMWSDYKKHKPSISLLLKHSRHFKTLERVKANAGNVPSYYNALKHPFFLGSYLQVQAKTTHQVTRLTFGRKMAVSHHERDGFLLPASQIIRKGWSIINSIMKAWNALGKQKH